MEHSTVLWTCIKISHGFQTFVLSIFECCLREVSLYILLCCVYKAPLVSVLEARHVCNFIINMALCAIRYDVIVKKICYAPKLYKNVCLEYDIYIIL